MRIAVMGEASNRPERERFAEAYLKMGDFDGRLQPHTRSHAKISLLTVVHAYKFLEFYFRAALPSPLQLPRHGVRFGKGQAKHGCDSPWPFTLGHHVSDIRMVERNHNGTDCPLIAP